MSEIYKVCKFYNILILRIALIIVIEINYILINGKEIQFLKYNIDFK